MFQPFRAEHFNNILAFYLINVNTVIEKFCLLVSKYSINIKLKKYNLFKISIFKWGISMKAQDNNNEFKKGKSIVINVHDSPVKITFAAEKNEKIADMIKSTLLNAYSAKIS